MWESYIVSQAYTGLGDPDVRSSLFYLELWIKESVFIYCESYALLHIITYALILKVNSLYDFVLFH